MVEYPFKVQNRATDFKVTENSSSVQFCIPHYNQLLRMLNFGILSK
jgi:hypothetical protein